MENLLTVTIQLYVFVPQSFVFKNQKKTTIEKGSMMSKTQTFHFYVQITPLETHHALLMVSFVLQSLP